MYQWQYSLTLQNSDWNETISSHSVYHTCSLTPITSSHLLVKKKQAEDSSGSGSPTLKKAFSVAFNGDSIIVGSGAYIQRGIRNCKGETSNSYISILKDSII